MLAQEDLPVALELQQVLQAEDAELLEVDLVGEEETRERVQPPSHPQLRPIHLAARERDQRLQTVRHQIYMTLVFTSV